MFPCNLPNLVDELTKLLKEMNSDLEEWRKMVSEARNYYYSLNYFTTQQLLFLRKELCPFINPNYQGSMKLSIMTLLQCISNHVTPSVVISHIRGEQDEDIETLLPSHRLTSPVINREPLQVPSGTLDLLTTDPSTVPQLEEEQLTDKQKSIMDNLISTYDFSRGLILSAFEHTPNPELEEEVEKWCNDNEEMFGSFNDGSVGEDDDCVPLEEFEEGEEEETLHEPPPPSTLSFTKVIIKPVTSVPVINEEHPSVKHLLLAGYTLDQCLEAVEKYPNDIIKAMEYLDMTEGHDNGREGLFPRQTPMDSSTLERQRSDGATK